MTSLEDDEERALKEIFGEDEDGVVVDLECSEALVAVEHPDEALVKAHAEVVDVEDTCVAGSTVKRRNKPEGARRGIYNLKDRSNRVKAGQKRLKHEVPLHQKIEVVRHAEVVRSQVGTDQRAFWRAMKHHYPEVADYNLRRWLKEGVVSLEARLEDLPVGKATRGSTLKRGQHRKTGQDALKSTRGIRDQGGGLEVR